MRRFRLAVSFVALVVLVCLLWAYRFERVDGLPAVRLADLRRDAPPMAPAEWLDTPEGLKLRLRLEPGEPQFAMRLRLPLITEVDLLHFRFRMTCRELVPGAATWEDGRFIVEWHHPDRGGRWENTPICTLRDTHDGDVQQVVIGSDQGPAVPMLRLEHLGRSGEFVLSDLEIIPIRERLVWKIGRWFLIAGWLAWGGAFVRSWPGIARWRAVTAAGIIVLTGIHFVIPGPWKILRPLYPEFRIGDDSAGASVPHPAQADPVLQKWLQSVPAGVLPVMGEIPDQGSWILRVKHRIKQARPILHALLLCGPVLACACLVGRKPALGFGILLGLAVEAAQFGFGYGFGWDDVLDLFNDSAGILLAMLAHRKLAARFPRTWLARTD